MLYLLPTIYLRGKKRVPIFFQTTYQKRAAVLALNWSFVISEKQIDKPDRFAEIFKPARSDFMYFDWFSQKIAQKK